MGCYDAFLSYAGEDERFANEICGALKSRGIKIWYAPINLMPGKNLLESIDKGLLESKSGIVLISKDFLRKEWTNYELDILLRQRIEKGKDLIPLWHNITKEDIDKKYPGLSGIFAINTAINMQAIVDKIVGIIAQNAPTIGIVPCWESIKYRFLSGHGEITLRNEHGPATTIWEFVLYSKNDEYPLFLDGELFSKESLLFKVATLIPHIPNIIDNWIGEEGRKKLIELCIKAGFNPNEYA